ncbi:RdgB/HAM1 family non-canonical purine NTP pyrophosphatase [Prochlorococcus sp. MIT 1307]|uniref:RdgB/HAM1 family non-canonical purine NTP pyrophosphatase n=1 Tax=Prochlorococcus sp. MIT 1307 TaxID=3096219 RepID=UPI002A762025|nr:RdgB/HAM1 family non-canonical purine NTP pyrophosphatase [Prochlorococcus sp. MIT 1307]
MTRPLLTIASGNHKKVAEIEAMLGPLPLTIQRQPKDLEVEETGSTYLENALLKAKAVAKVTSSWVIADDSGLEVDALNGQPGIYSARFAKTNEKKLQKILDALGNSPYRSARFHSVMILCDPEGNPVKSAEGICWGELLKEPAYPGGEFESLFWVREAQCTYGELTQEQLSKLGSRGKAAREIAPYLRQALEIS